METIGGEEFERGARAAAAAHRLLACCKGLLARDEEELRKYFSHESLKEFIEDPRVREAYAVIAHVEGGDAEADPLLKWPLKDLHLASQLSLDALAVAGAVTLDDLLDRDPLDLIEAGIGPGALRRIQDWLHDFGLSLAGREDPPPASHPIFAMPVTRLLYRVSGRTIDALKTTGIVTVADLLEWTAEDLLELHGMGPILLDGLESELRSYGLALAERPDPAEVI